MADQGIKKVIIPKASLPPAGKNREYLVRYRIASQDKNRYSHWSPIYKVIGKELTLVEGVIQKVGSIIMVAWAGAQDVSSYDIFVKYDDQTTYTYHGSSTSNNYSIINQGTSMAYIAVQIGGIFKERKDSNTIYTDSISLV
jgi:hypothetical protein